MNDSKIQNIITVLKEFFPNFSSILTIVYNTVKNVEIYYLT